MKKNGIPRFVTFLENLKQLKEVIKIINIYTNRKETGDCRKSTANKVIQKFNHSLAQ